MKITAKPYKRQMPTTETRKGGLHWVVPTDEGEKIIHEIAAHCGTAPQNWLRRMKTLGWRHPHNLEKPHPAGSHPRENAFTVVRIRALGPPRKDPGKATRNHPEGLTVVPTTIGTLTIQDLADELSMNPSRISVRLAKIPWQDEQCLADKREYGIIAQRKHLAKRQQQLAKMEEDLGALKHLSDEPRDHLLRRIPAPGKYERRWSDAIDRRTIQRMGAAGIRSAT